MKQEDLRIYATRITQASKSELVVILYDIILHHMDNAKTAYNQNELDIFDKELKSAQKFMVELMGGLDCTYPIGLDLMSLYLYVNKNIILAIIKRKLELLDIAQTIMESLRTGFIGISKQDDSKPVMQNTQQVYAGLTYGRGTLNESYIDPNHANRGFKA